MFRPFVQRSLSLHLGSTFNFFSKNLLIPSATTYPNTLNLGLSEQKKNIVIIGGGVVGVSTAHALLRDTNYNVVLIEKHPNVAEETSNDNGGIFGVEYNIIWVSKKIKDHFKRFLTIKDYPFYFHWKALLERNMFGWIINMFIKVFSEDNNLKKIDNLAQLSKKEFDLLIKEIPISKFDAMAEGLISVYEYKKDLEESRKFYENKIKQGFNVKFVEEKEILEKEPILKNSKFKFEVGALWPVETNVDTVKFTRSIKEHCENAYKDRFRFVAEGNVESFIFEKWKSKKEISGVLTKKGAIFGEKFICCAGLQSIELMRLLRERVLLAPVKGYTMSLRLEGEELNKKQVNYIVSDEKNRMSFSQIGDKIRIAAFAEFRGRDKSKEPRRIEQIKRNLFDNIGEFPDERLSFWVGLRPVSPDDVPVIGLSRYYDNMYLNFGHGSKGTTLGLGAAKLLSEIIQEKTECSLTKEDYRANRFY